MDIFDFIAAVLGGNILTAMFIYGAVQFTKKETRGEWSWYNWGLIMFPLAFLIVALLSTGEHPPYLDAIAAQRPD